MSAQVDYAQAGELKFGQVGIANLRVRTLEPAQLAAEMRERVERAPNLFARAAVVLDFGGLSKVPSLDEARALVDGLREAGVLPVALAYGTKEVEALSQRLGLPLLAKFRAQYERTDGNVAQPSAPVRVETAAATPAAVAPAPPLANVQPGLMQPTPVRSGQQVYAENRDLTCLAAVGAGAEVIARDHARVTRTPDDSILAPPGPPIHWADCPDRTEVRPAAAGQPCGASGAGDSGSGDSAPGTSSSSSPSSASA